MNNGRIKRGQIAHEVGSFAVGEEVEVGLPKNARREFIESDFLPGFRDGKSAEMSDGVEQDQLVHGNRGRSLSLS
jgi:hypothetical protein